jgi:hypothetical protein
MSVASPMGRAKWVRSRTRRRPASEVDMRRALLATIVGVLAATLAAGASAQSSSEKQRQRAEDTIREGAEKIVRGLEQMIRSLPQYDMPEVLPNGDIVIRRRPPREPRDKVPAPDGPSQT